VSLELSKSSKVAWWVLRLSNLSTILREWTAVHSLARIAMRDVILGAKVRPGACSSLHWCAAPLMGCSETHAALLVALQPIASLLAREKLEVPPKMRQVMSGMYNESQMAAVTAGLDGSPLVLVQGPPGEGALPGAHRPAVCGAASARSD